jgi:hypothetical protein
MLEVKMKHLKLVVDSDRNNLPISVYTTLIHAVEKDEGIIIISNELHEAIIDALNKQNNTPKQMALPIK